MGYCGIMAIPTEDDPADELLLVAIVEMTPESIVAGQQYEDRVLILLGRHGGTLERRMRSADGSAEVQVIRFRSRSGLESFMVDPDRLRYRAQAGDAAPATRVLEVRDVEPRRTGSTVGEESRWHQAR